MEPGSPIIWLLGWKSQSKIDNNVEAGLDLSGGISVCQEVKPGKCLNF